MLRRFFPRMTIQYKSDDDGRVDAERDTIRAMSCGVRGRCPACGKGRLFSAWLKVADTCDACGTELHHHRADDAPAYFTIFIVGHLVIGPLLWTEIAYQPSYWVHFTVWPTLTIALSVLLLPRIKGALVGLQWAQRMHGFNPDNRDEEHLAASTPVRDAP
ncbi:MAG: DUF983 domain-containing protein [Pseudomonadota bacterium]